MHSQKTQTSNFGRKNFKNYLSALFTFLCILPYIMHAHAQTQSIKQKLTYPVTIPQVGTCDSWADCRRICADPVNTQSCSSWAISQKLVQPKPSVDSVIQKAQAAFGCTSKESCIAFCSQKEHYEVCSTFAKKAQIPGGYDSRAQQVSSIIADPAIQQAIAEELKILDPEYQPGVGINLKNICQKEEHKAVCTSLAEKLGIGGGAVVSGGPSGCKSAQTCIRYCITNTSDASCVPFLSQVEKSTAGRVTGQRGQMIPQAEIVQQLMQIKEKIATGASREQFEQELNMMQKKLAYPTVALSVPKILSSPAAIHSVSPVISTSQSTRQLPIVPSTTSIHPKLSVSPTRFLTPYISPSMIQGRYSIPTAVQTVYLTPTLLPATQKSTPTQYPTKYPDTSSGPVNTATNLFYQSQTIQPTVSQTTERAVTPTTSPTQIQGVSTEWTWFDWVKWLFVR